MFPPKSASTHREDTFICCLKHSPFVDSEVVSVNVV